MPTRPNILMIFCDQLRADALGSYGHSFVRTPAFDRVAEEGTTFTSAYTPSPVCVPARCSLITGLYPHRTDCVDNGSLMPEDVPTLMSQLAAAGYRTHGVGKMHFTPDAYAPRGFTSRDTAEAGGADPDRDDYRGYLEQSGYGDVSEPLGLRNELYYLPQRSPVPAAVHYSTWVADRTVDFLGDQTDDQPFFCWASFFAPHPPFAPPSPWHALYPPLLMPDAHVPVTAEGLLTAHDRQQRRYKIDDLDPDSLVARALRAYYLGSVSFVDVQVGRILAALHRQGLVDSTIIMVTADHGEFLGDYGTYGKRSFLDPAARVPLLISGPDVGQGSLDVPASLVDVAPTLWAAAGVQDPPAGDGLDLLGASRHDVVYGQFQQGSAGLYAAVTSRWKYYYSAADRQEYLIDRVVDPRETRNRAYNARCRPALLALRRLAQKHHAEMAGLDLDAVCGNGALAEQLGRDGAGLGIDLSRTDAGALVISEAGPPGVAGYRLDWNAVDSGP